MFEIEWHIITLIIISFHFVVGVFNVGVTMAYVTRGVVENNQTPKKSFDMFFTVFLSGLFGMFSFPTSLAACSFPDFGWKLWPGEIMHPRNKWADRLMSLQMKKEEALARRRRNSEITGNCESIWE